MGRTNLASAFTRSSYFSFFPLYNKYANMPFYIKAYYSFPIHYPAIKENARK